MATLIRRLLGLIPRTERRGWVWIAVLATVVTVLEIIGALLVFALLGLVTTAATGSVELPVLGATDSIFPSTSRSTLIIVFAAIVAVFYILRGALVVGQSYLQTRLAQRTGTALSKRLYRYYLGMPYDQHIRLNSADLIRNTHSAVIDVVNYGFLPIVRLASTGLVVVGLMTVLLLVAPLPTLLVVVAIAPPVLVLLRVVQPRLTRLGHRSQEIAAGIVRTLQESLHGFREVRTLGAERVFDRAFDGHRRGFEDVESERVAIGRLPGVFIQATLVTAVAVLLVLAVVRGEDLQRTLAVIGLFGYTAMRLLPSLSEVTTAINDLRYGGAVLDIIDEDLRVTADGANLPPRVEPLYLSDRIVLQDVTYAYPGADEPAVRDVSVVIERGESVGVVGATGAGKSTLIDLLLGLVTPTDGTVSIDGMDLSDPGTIRRWHATVGVVPQSIFLIDGTLRANIALGADDEVDAERLERSVQMAQLEDFVSGLPEGLGTRVGERGVRLSGGQRQRVAIARALYRDPEVLIFDEGTSALDNATEAELVAAIERLRADRTIVTVAHRLSTVERCDRILVMEDGRIVASGSYRKLEAQDETFQRLARRA